MEVLFDRILDVTAVISTVFYVVTIYVIVKRTPKDMLSFSVPLLNILLWSVFINVIWAVARPYPMMPLTCFQLRGILAALINSEIETIGHIVFALTVLVIVNICVGLFLCFQFRYITIVYSTNLIKFKTSWLILYAVALHVVFSLVCLYLNSKWAIFISDYPTHIDPSLRKELFCFDPFSVTYILFGLVFGCFIAISLIVFVFLSFCKLRKNEEFITETTAKMQKTILWNLIFLSAIPIVFGGLPYYVLLVSLYYHDAQSSQVMSVLSMLIILDHGPIFCVTCLVRCKMYRDSLKSAILNLCSVKGLLSTRVSNMTNQARQQ